MVTGMCVAVCVYVFVCDYCRVFGRWVRVCVRGCECTWVWVCVRGALTSFRSSNASVKAKSSIPMPLANSLFRCSRKCCKRDSKTIRVQSSESRGQRGRRGCWCLAASLRTVKIPFFSPPFSLCPPSFSLCLFLSHSVSALNMQIISPINTNVHQHIQEKHLISHSTERLTQLTLPLCSHTLTHKYH